MAFYDDAWAVAREVNVDVAYKNENADEPVPFVKASPRHASICIKTMLQAGRKVAIIEKASEGQLDFS